jgi:exosortase N
MIALASAALFMMRDYFVLRIQIILGLLCLPFIFRIREKDVHSHRYGIIAFAMLIVYVFLQSKILLYLSLGCLVFYSVELLSGKVGMLPLLFLLFLSPAVFYLANIFTFSIRLEISNQAAQLLSLTGMQVKNYGSYFEMNDGSMFRVDKECMGLNMICTGLSITILLIAFAENKIKKYLRLLPIGILTMIAFSLLILTNLLRIIGLVLFKAPPESYSHDLIGLLSLIAYMIVPMYFIVQFVVKKLGYEKKVIKSSALPYRNRLVILALLSLVVILTGNVVMDLREEKVSDEKLHALKLEGYKRTLKDEQVVEYRMENSLIYIKPGVHSYESDHPPYMCWQGNGFELCSFKKESIGEFSIMTGQLKKGDAIQYTAWWYDNGIDKTVDQWKWRFSKGEPYRIINITTKSKAELDNQCADFLARRLF